VVSQVEDAMEGEVEFGIEGESATSSRQMSDSAMAATVTSYVLLACKKMSGGGTG
jgi:hypothetical protein